MLPHSSLDPLSPLAFLSLSPQYTAAAAFTATADSSWAWPSPAPPSIDGTPPRPTLPISRPSRSSTPPLAPAQITLECRSWGRTEKRSWGRKKRRTWRPRGRKKMAPSFPKLVFASTVLAPPLLPATTPATVCHTYPVGML
ncbi:hypothetical protein VPH35_036406 [Triticum aestivum]